MREIGKLSLVAVWCLGFSVATMLVGCFKSGRAPYCYVFPKDFSGWVSVRYSVPTGINPTSIGKCLALDFQNSTHVTVSAPPPVGLAADRFIEVRDARHVDLDPSAADRPPLSRCVRERLLETNAGQSTEWIFLGTAEQFASTSRPVSTR